MFVYKWWSGAVVRRCMFKYNLSRTYLNFWNSTKTWDITIHTLHYKAYATFQCSLDW